MWTSSRRVPGEPARGDVLGERRQAGDERLDLGVGQEPGAPQAADVGDRARDVVGGEGGIDLDRAREVGDALVGLSAEPAAPGPHRCLRLTLRMLTGAGRKHAVFNAARADGDRGPAEAANHAWTAAAPDPNGLPL